MFGKIVVNNERVSAVVTKMFAHRRTGVGGNELHRSGIAGSGANDNGVIHRTSFFQRLHNTDDGGFLLADGNVNTHHVAAFLIDNRVDADGGLAGLPVADDEFALAAANRNHRVDGL